MRIVALLAFTSFLFPGCEKAVTFDLNENETKLVVEATIENGQPPLVILSRSLSFFSTLSPEALSNSFVRNAEVFVSNGQLTHQLKGYTISFAPGLSAYYYSTDSSNLGTSFVGEVNTNYSLLIRYNGEEYTATTTIPKITKRIDSIYWKPAPGNPGKAAVIVKVTDPPGLGDYIRYFTKQNNQPFYPALNSVFDDQIIDGTTYEVEIERGLDRNLEIEEDYNFFDRGDTVVFKLSNINKATFEFWRTMEFSYGTIGNPFSSQTKVLGNISNGALGYFGGYASQFRTLIIPE